MSKLSRNKNKKKRIKLPAEYTEGSLHFKTGPGWKACYDSARELYTAEAFLAGYYDLYEINEEIFSKLKTKGMKRRDAHELIIAGRHLYKSVSDRNSSYDIAIDESYASLCPWADVQKTGEMWEPELTKLAVAMFEPENLDRGDKNETNNDNLRRSYHQSEGNRMRKYGFYGWETADVKDKHGLTPRDFYDMLSEIWCAETCAPRMRCDWSPENKTLGQCSITAFLMQDIYGGKVLGVPLGDGNFHCFNVVGDCTFDLTSEQFGNKKLNYADSPEQFREIHFAKEEKKQRYEALKALLFARLPLIIETERLILRPFVESDAADVYEYLREPAVNCFACMKLDSLDEAKKEMKNRVSETEYYFAIVLKENGKVIGEIDAYPETGEPHAGENDPKDTFSPCWMLNKAYHGQGYAYEAAHSFFDYLFNKKGARRIYAYTEDYNIPSQRLCERLGMRREGLFLEFVSFVNGLDGKPKYENTYQYAILKKEWR